MPRPCVVITTYARPDGLGRLLDDLEREAPPQGLDVHVYDDATPHPDPNIRARIHANGWNYRRAPVNHGKRGWWRWWNTILEDLEPHQAERFYVLQDDVRLCGRFFARADALFDGIADPRRTSLVLHLTAERSGLGERCWTPVRAERAGQVVHCGWVDFPAFVADRRLFEAVGWRLEPIAEQRWDRAPTLSSGVGQQLSLRAHKARLRMYRADVSLAVHDGGPSLMNAAARERVPMDTIAFVDGDAAARKLLARRPYVFASLASIPRRERGLEAVVGALLPQVDGLGVYLNGYDHVPSVLEADERIDIARSQDHGDRGDAGKFHWAGAQAGYHLVCDDDLHYPPDYVTRLIDGIERHGRRAVVGFHGHVMHDNLTDYHRSRRLLHFSRALRADTPVHILGTGACGYHAAALKIAPSDFAEPNMADVWLGLLGQRQGVPFVCLAHEDDWLYELPGYGHDSLYSKAAGAKAPSRETLAVRGHGRWHLHTHPMPATTSKPTRQRPPAAPGRPVPEPELVRVNVAGPQRGATLVLPGGDHITEAIRRSGTYYERDLLDAIRARRPRGTFVDVGAHYGNHTTFFALECAAEHVVAIEPSAHAHAGLLETVAENGLRERVRVHRIAAHPSWRNVTVRALPWRPPPEAPGRTNSGRVAVTQTGDTPAAPLDEILDGVAPVGLVKVDAEGLSADILASGIGVLRRDRPLVAAEAATPPERGALRAIMSALGYRELEPSYCWTPTWLWEPV